MDLYRPIYHFMPEKNWMNDPNGPIYYKGEYHLFYQTNPNDYHWDTINWGHAKSKDLVHWDQLPIALYPSNELGEKHCFSGCALINDQGIPTIYYTSVGEGQRHQSVGAEQWMALSHDDMVTWEKHKNNPRLTLDLHENLDIKEWRDPFVWKDGVNWYMVLGGSHNGNGCVLIYNSKNSTDWKFLNILYETNQYKFLECPNLFKLGDKYVLIYSPNDMVVYHTGILSSDFTFTTEYQDIFDNSGWEGYYAPNSFVEPNGRRIIWGWMTESSRGEFEGSLGWSGAQSIPRMLSLGDNVKLKIEPVPELEILRTDERLLMDVKVNCENMNLGVQGRAFEIKAEFEINGDEEFSIQVLKSPDGKEQTSVSYNATNGELTVDRSKSSLSDLPHKSKLSTNVYLSKGEILKLHIFVDHSIIEVFANYEKCISTRIYPTAKDSTGVSLSLTKASELNIKSFAIWKMKSIW